MQQQWQRRQWRRQQWRRQRGSTGLVRHGGSEVKGGVFPRASFKPGRHQTGLPTSRVWSSISLKLLQKNLSQVCPPACLLVDFKSVQLRTGDHQHRREELGLHIYLSLMFSRHLDVMLGTRSPLKMPISTAITKIKAEMLEGIEKPPTTQ